MVDFYPGLGNRRSSQTVNPFEPSSARFATEPNIAASLQRNAARARELLKVKRILKN
jgi:hypothetical protein